MFSLILATHNRHKIKELASSLQNCRLQSLSDIGFNRAIPEPFSTFKYNAFAKAYAVYTHIKSDTAILSEDSGLMVKVLDNAPGVRSARYAGGAAGGDDANISKLLSALEQQSDRKAVFKTVLCLIKDNRTYFFEGSTEGLILRQRQGSNLFGYDPVFQPIGADKSFAAMPLNEKKQWSHREKALRSLGQFLKTS